MSVILFKCMVQEASNYHSVLAGSRIHGKVIMQCGAEELDELLLDAERALPGKTFDGKHRRFVTDRLLALKQNAQAGSVAKRQCFHNIDDMHIKSRAESAFRTLQSLFPSDARVLDLDLAALCDWPDFAASRWQQCEVAVPLLGVMSVGGTSFVHTEEFSRFFPRECCGAVSYTHLTLPTKRIV